MYRPLLIRKYLTRKMVPLLAALAVTLCTAMVVIVLSVMSGFLGMMGDNARKLTGDVVVSRNLAGFPYYQEMVDALEAQPEVEAACPAIQAFALMELDRDKRPIQVMGVDPERVGKVLAFDPMWTSEDKASQLGISVDLLLKNGFDLKEMGHKLQSPNQNGQMQPAAVIGIEVNRNHTRDQNGQYSSWNMLCGRHIALSMVPVNEHGDAGDWSPRRTELTIANEVKSGFYEADANRVFVPLTWLQTQLEMQSHEVVSDFDPITGEGGDTSHSPARVTDILVRAKEGVSADQLRPVVESVVFQVCREHHVSAWNLRISTWREVHGSLLRAVENERGMMTFLFCVIFIVAIMMVGLTFYMVVLEKTRDIGILRTLGATRSGIATLFVEYGLAIGLIGSGAGLLLAHFVVSHLNNLQQALAHKLWTLIIGILSVAVLSIIAGAFAAWRGRRRDAAFEWGLVASLLTLFISSLALYWLFPTLGSISLGELHNTLNLPQKLVIWDPQIYYFDRIPDQVDWDGSIKIAIGAVFSSVVGALIPAIVAACVDPVRAMRHE